MKDAKEGKFGKNLYSGGWGDYSSFRHAQRRARQRHGLSIDFDTYRELCYKAFLAPVKKKVKGGRVVKVITHNKKKLRVVLDPKGSTIVTFLPKGEKKG